MKRLGILALAVFAAAPALAMQAGQGPILLRAKGPIAAKMAAGKPLPIGARFALVSGDVLMLLDGRGVRTLTGPGYLQNGAFTRTGPSAAGSGERVGAVRGGPGGSVPRAADGTAAGQNWVVPLDRIGAVCLPADHRLTLWRQGGPASAIEVQPAGSGVSRNLTWAAHAERLAWPNDLPTTPGARYRLTSQGVGGAREIEFRTLSPSDPACTSQIDFNVDLAASDTDEQMLDEYLN